MPIPVNIDAAHAIELGPTLPVTYTQDANFGGVTYTLWFKYTAPVTGTVYYFRCQSSTGNVGTAILTIHLYLAPALGVPAGSIFVNDDTDLFPAAIISSINGVGILNFINPFPHGEQGDILNDGTQLVTDDNGDFLRMYDKDFNLIHSPSYPQSSGSRLIRTCQLPQKFYIGNTGHGVTPASANTCTSAGVIGTTIGPFATSGMLALAASNDETVLYYHNGSSSASQVRRWATLSNTALTDLVAAIPNYIICDMLVLGDDSIVVLYFRSSNKDVNVLRYDAAGTLLNTYAFGTLHASTTPKLAYAIDDPNSFWVWNHASALSTRGQSIFTNVKVSDGSTINEVRLIEYEGGGYQGDPTMLPTNNFGNSFSCPFYILRQSTVPVFNSVLGEFSVGQDLVTYIPTNCVFSPNGVTNYLGICSTVPIQIPIDTVVSAGVLTTGIISVQKITNPVDDTVDFNLQTNAVSAITPVDATPSIRLIRTASLPSIANFTIMAWFKLPTTDLAPGDYYSFFSLEDGLSPESYYFLGTKVDTTVLEFDYGDGVTDVLTDGLTLPKDTWFHLTMVVTGLNVKIYYNGVLELDVTNLGTPVLNELYLMIDADLGKVSCANCKVWSRSLTVDDIRLEKWSTVVTNPLNIYLATPFLTLSSYLTDLSGAGHDWSLSVGTPQLTLGYIDFQLRSHEFQAFIVPVGSGYYIIEPTHTGYQLSYVVSNDETNNNNNNITVADTDDDSIVIVTVNNYVSTGYGGLYKIVPGKTDDTVWLSITGYPPTTVTADLKIPDPFADTFFVGG